MGKHAAATTRPTAQQTRRGGAAQHALAGHPERHVRRPWSLPLFASAASAALVLAVITDHSPVMAAEAAPSSTEVAAQELFATDDYSGSIERGDWTTEKVVTYGTAPAAGTPDPGTAQAIAWEMVTARGWDAAQFDCLVALWGKESGWNVYAHNKTSGAYGIPQALPGSKMAVVADDWATNPATQITWGLAYITGRYGDPCGAWGHSQRVGWY